MIIQWGAAVRLFIDPRSASVRAAPHWVHVQNFLFLQKYTDLMGYGETQGWPGCQPTFAQSAFTYDGVPVSDDEYQLPSFAQQSGDAPQPGTLISSHGHANRSPGSCCRPG